ncbi:uncharacterized protein LOC121855134 [Homarus americanus]|uniref:uncharacterized protein LOC121855134 n=1 Tax=Homarus americanus TaxID=6706 RepID=UPI001C44964E|nr:uncharacterized protein LOC121855134 [Homarus americanus]
MCLNQHPPPSLGLAHGSVVAPEEGGGDDEPDEGGGRKVETCDTCPYFLNTTVHVTTSQGVPANLTCGVRNLVDRKVSWIRRKDLHVLTTGAFTYTTDGRFRALHLVGSPYWTLQVDAPLVSDSGVYECQVSTQPKIFRRFTLSVVVPSAEIQGTHQMFMKAGSDINITCIVTGNVRGSPVTWYHTLPRHTTSVEVEEINAGGRGGVQLVTDKHAGTSWLLVTHATWRDAGNYTCAPANARPATVAIHVLDEEAPAAMQHDLQPNAASKASTPTSHVLLAGVHLLLLLEAHWGRIRAWGDGVRWWWGVVVGMVTTTTPRRVLSSTLC